MEKRKLHFRFWKEIWAFRSTFILILTPLILLPLPLIVQTDPARCGYVLLLMAVYWTTETLPLAVTALLPVLLFPLFGLMKTKDVCSKYISDINMLFLGGIVVATALENSNLHKRIALRILTIVGAKPRWLMLGFMLPTAFLSMWISNTATTAMMIPIAEAVLDQIGKPAKVTNEYDVNAVEMEEKPVSVESAPEKPLNGSAVPTVSSTVVDRASTTASSVNLIYQSDDHLQETVTVPMDTTPVEDRRKAKFTEICKGLTLSVPYAANVGGTATLTGTGTNLVMKGAVDALYEQYGLESPVTFASWMGMCLPAAIIKLTLVWIILQLIFIGFRESVLGSCACRKKRDDASKKQEIAIQQLLRDEYKKLGKIRFNEISVSVIFVILVLLWFFRNPGFMPGWASAFKSGYVANAVPAVLMSVLVFVWPSRWPNFLCLRREDDDSEIGPVPPLLDWPTAQRKLPWGILFLLGGGFALAAGVNESGLAQWIGNQLTVFRSLPGWALVLILCILVTFLTEVTSNTATATILMPIMAQLAMSIGRNPVYLMFPVAVSTSYAFMLPVATPPNAIAFSYGRVKVRDMVRGGFLLNFICVGVIVLAVHTWGQAIFRFDVIPWATTTGQPNDTIMSSFNQLNATANPCL